MPLPPAVSTKTLHGEIVHPASGAPAAGKVAFVMPYALRDGADNVIVGRQTLVADLDESGEFTITLIVNDDADLSPQGWQYTVVVATTAWADSFPLEITSAMPATVELADIAPAVDPEELSTYVLLSTVGQANGVASLGSDGKVPSAQLPPGSGGGAVDSVNGETGTVVLDAGDVGAAEAAHTHAAADIASGTIAIARIPTGQTGTTVPLGNDSRFSDARTPTAHASTHASAGSDPVTLAQSQVTGLTASLAGKSDTGHVHAGTDITSGTVAYARLPVGTTSSTVAAGDDSRLSDARTPTAHAASHGVGQSDAVTVAQSQVTGLAASLAALQPLDADLTAIAGLTPTNDDIVQRKAGAWTNRTIAQLKTDLAITAGDVGAQPADSDLTDIAALAPANDSIIQRKSGIWVARSMAQVKTDLAITASDVGAPALTLVDAKGDLLAGSGADTLVRVPVGANGLVLTADSGETAGIRWGAAGGALPDALMPRAAFQPAGGTITNRSSKAATLNVAYLLPFSLFTAATLSMLDCETTNATASAVVRFGIYGSNSSHMPDALINDFGTTACATATTVAVSVSQALSASTLYWVAICFQTAAPNVRHGGGRNPWVSSATFPAGTGAGWNIAYFQTGVTGSLPASFSSNGDTDAPIVGLKF